MPVLGRSVSGWTVCTLAPNFKKMAAAYTHEDLRPQSDQIAHMAAQENSALSSIELELGQPLGQHPAVAAKAAKAPRDVLRRANIALAQHGDPVHRAMHIDAGH